MIDTNALLLAAISLITNFSQIVPMPKDQVPITPSQLSWYLVGSPNSPYDVAVTARSGSHFWITDGTVSYYLSSNSYFHKPS